ncbi:Monooxygenase FAD-binding protein [Neofusicoccum parvum]|uniref:Monooxygenase FAD-binding protein n=1 Tax=Neofusicoccum parvum TaxID=310453 RepID=A0ACB5RS48_9PEZI|nr:Monooxygenase FAD-binding protein [Neofusicoccum parvum]
MSSQEHVTVGIVGGGIAGLTLANILEQSGISYILWEARDEIAPPEGASLGLMPNGLRILDQLGLIDELEEYAVPHDCWEYRDGEGTLFNTLTAMRSYPELLGYQGYFMERQRVLEILYAGIKDKTWIQTSKRVSSVLSLSLSATITAIDGTQITCDFVAGADGVRSVVRREIEAALPELQMTPDNFSSKCACIYGMSSPLRQIGAGRFFTIHQKDVSALIFSGLGGALYWFIVVDLKTSVEFGKTKRYTDADIKAAYTKVAHATITDGVKFSDIFKNRRTAIMTPLEEGVADAWYSGRMFVLGDSAHKMVPHVAMGANQAIESAACFANLLFELRKKLGGTLANGVPPSDVEAHLKKYAEKCSGRTSGVIQSASFNCQVQLKIGPAVEPYMRALPYMTNEAWLSMVLETFCKAEKIEDWNRNSARVDYYTEHMRTLREKIEKGEGIFATTGNCPI